MILSTELDEQIILSMLWLDKLAYVATQFPHCNFPVFIHQDNFCMKQTFLLFKIYQECSCMLQTKDIHVLQIQAAPYTLDLFYFSLKIIESPGL